MKKLLSVCLFLSLLSYAVSSQPYTTTWPYLYPDFMDGVIHMRGGQDLSCRLNVHLLNGRLHYLDDEIVKEAISGDMLYVEIGGDRFKSVNGNIMRVEAESTGGFVAAHITGDFESLMVGKSAYGMTANTESITQVSSLDLQKGINTNHMLLLQGKEEGQEFDLQIKYYIIAEGRTYPAYRGDILKMLPEDRKSAFKSFVKENRIKWDDPQKLILLVDFLGQD